MRGFPNNLSCFNNNLEKVKKYCDENIRGQISIIYEDKNLGFWGHGIRNKHNKLKGDFIFHIDDDEIGRASCRERV